MQIKNTKICTNVNCTLLRCAQTERRANPRGGVIAYKFNAEVDARFRSRQREPKQKCVSKRCERKKKTAVHVQTETRKKSERRVWRKITETN